VRPPIAGLLAALLAVACGHDGAETSSGAGGGSGGVGAGPTTGYGCDPFYGTVKENDRLGEVPCPAGEICTNFGCCSPSTDPSCAAHLGNVGKNDGFYCVQDSGWQRLPRLSGVPGTVCAPGLVCAQHGHGGAAGVCDFVCCDIANDPLCGVTRERCNTQ
jgi:hypothetical protein